MNMLGPADLDARMSCRHPKMLQGGDFLSSAGRGKSNRAEPLRCLFSKFPSFRQLIEMIRWVIEPLQSSRMSWSRRTADVEDRGLDYTWSTPGTFILRPTTKEALKTSLDSNVNKRNRDQPSFLKPSQPETPSFSSTSTKPSLLILSDAVLIHTVSMLWSMWSKLPPFKKNKKTSRAFQKVTADPLRQKRRPIKLKSGKNG